MSKNLVKNINSDIHHLIAHIDVSVLGQQQRHKVHAAFLRCQVNGTDALPRHCVGVGAVLQQSGPDVHLVLFGSNVERRVAILTTRNGKSEVRWRSMDVAGGLLSFLRPSHYNILDNSCHETHESLFNTKDV